MTFSNALSWTKSFVLWLKFHWSLILRVQLTMNQQRDRWHAITWSNIDPVHWHIFGIRGRWVKELNYPGSIWKDKISGNVSARKFFRCYLHRVFRHLFTGTLYVPNCFERHKYVYSICIFYHLSKIKKKIVCWISPPWKIMTWPSDIYCGCW